MRSGLDSVPGRWAADAGARVVELGAGAFAPGHWTIQGCEKTVARVLLGRHAEQPARVRVFGHPQCAIRSNLDVADAVTDIPDGWEREGEDPEYFYRFSPDAYAVGINVVLYAMAH